MANRNTAKTNASAPSAAEIEAFLAAKAETEAKEKAAADKAKKEKKKVDFTLLAMHVCKVTGGRKYEVGAEYPCIWVGKNRFGDDTARLIVDGSDKAWINPKFLEAVKPMPAEKVASIKAQREVESSETVMVPASVGRETDGAVLLSYSGWFGPKWFPKKHVTRLGETAEGLGVYEVPAWKVRKDTGNDSYEALVAKQEAIEASIVEAKAS